MTIRFISKISVALAAAGWLLCAQAQESDGAAELVLITPKAGQGPALEAAIAEYHHWVASKPGAWRYTWFQIETGPDTGKYIARSGGHNWADFDEDFDWEAEADAKFAADVLPLIEHSERWLSRQMADLSNMPEDMRGYTLFRVTNWYVKSGQFGKFNAGLEKIHKTLSEGGFKPHYGFAEMVSGGNANGISLVIPMKGYADFKDPQPSFFDVMSEALGGPEEFAQFMSDWGSTYEDGDSILVRYLPEASDYGDAE